MANFFARISIIRGKSAAPVPSSFDRSVGHNMVTSVANLEPDELDGDRGSEASIGCSDRVIPGMQAVLNSVATAA